MNCLLVVSLFLLVSSVFGSPKPYYDIADAEKHFADFVDKYGKDYESDEEYNRRFQIFKTRLEEINELNAIHEASFDVHEYTDMDWRNSNCYSSAAMNVTDIVDVDQKWVLNAPFPLDYRTQGVVSRVKDQGNCNNCYVFAAVGNIESRYAIQTRKLRTLSEQQATDCAASCQNGGIPHDVMDRLTQTSGLVREVLYPYVGQPEPCRAVYDNQTVRVSGRTIVSTPTNEHLMAALAQYGPVAVGIFMTPTLHNFKGKIAVTPRDCPVGQAPNHAVLLVGYARDALGQPHWIIKNSWGLTYGDNGYLLMSMSGGKLCSLAFQGAAVANVY